MCFTELVDSAQDKLRWWQHGVLFLDIVIPIFLLNPVIDSTFPQSAFLRVAANCVLAFLLIMVAKTIETRMRKRSSQAPGFKPPGELAGSKVLGLYDHLPAPRQF